MKFLLKFLFVFLFLLSCSNKVEQYYIHLSKTTMVFPWGGESQSLFIDTNTEWSVVTDLPSWINLNINSETEIELVVGQNETDKQRSCLIIFSAGGVNAELAIEQNVEPMLSFRGSKKYNVLSEYSTFEVELVHNVPYKVKILDDAETWIQQQSNSSVGEMGKSKLSFIINENLSPHQRKAKIVVLNNPNSLSDTLFVMQEGGDGSKYLDGEYRLKQQALKGNVNLVVLGDGFVSKSLKEGGAYERAMDEAISYLFSIEPYKTYREYFNVYMVVAESEEEGVGKKSPFGGSSVKNKFGTAFGEGTEIVCNDELIFEYARKVKELPKDKPITVLVVLNSDKYAGTAYLYPDGNSIALCPMSAAEPPNDFEGIVHHEAGGHAFGFLVDEYVYNQAEMPESRKKEIQEWQKQGYQMNLDFTDDLDKILWKDFIGIDKYAPVGAYEGGYEYQYGVWRSEENSCMNNNIPYYNVQSRWNIVNRIMQLSDIEFSVQDFIENDHPIYPKGSRGLNTWEKFVPLGNPVWVVK